jgi:hypothetical protein
MLARCPNCRNTFSTDRAGRQDCPICGKPLVVPEQGTGPSPELQPEGVQQSPGTPWERRAELGFVTAWARTVQEALLEPGKLFADARLDRGPAQLGFAVLTASVFGAIGQGLGILVRAQSDAFFQRMLSQQDMPDFLRDLLKTSQSMSSSPGGFLLGVLLLPLFNFLFVYLNAGVTHLFALLLGQSKRGFSATFAACTYSFAPLVLLAVPGCGGIVALLWLIVLTGVGLKVTHGIKPGGAAATVLAPYAVFCCLGCVSAVVLGAALRNMLGHP